VNDQRREELQKQYMQLYHELDEWRQKDNHILFELGNPPELDDERGRILQKMREITGEMQRLRRQLEE